MEAYEFQWMAYILGWEIYCGKGKKTPLKYDGLDTNTIHPFFETRMLQISIK